MDIEVEVIGTPVKRVFSQARLRIGTDILSDIRLSPQQFPAVQPEHLTLEVVRGVVKVSGQAAGSAVTLRGGVPLTAGTAIHTGDTLQLGSGGPEVRIRLLDWETRVADSVHEPTTVLAAEVAAPDSNAARDPQPPARLTGAKPAVASVTATGAWAEGTAPGPAASSKPAATLVSESETVSLLSGRLRLMQLLLGANLLVLLGLALWLVQLNREVSESHKEVLALRSQARDAVGQFTPALDARLAVLQTRMDGMDVSLKAAEDRMIQRLDREIPSILDRYLNGKMATTKP